MPRAAKNGPNPSNRPTPLRGRNFRVASPLPGVDLGGHELRLLWILYERRGASIRELIDENRVPELSYTVTNRAMIRMYRKGVLRRKAEGRTYHYSPVFKQTELRKAILNGELRRFADSCWSPLMLFSHLLDIFAQDQYLIDRIKELLKRRTGSL